MPAVQHVQALLCCKHLHHAAEELCLSPAGPMHLLVYLDAAISEVLKSLYPALDWLWTHHYALPVPNPAQPQRLHNVATPCQEHASKTLWMSMTAKKVLFLQSLAQAMY